MEQERKLREQAEERLNQWHRHLVVPLAQWAGQHVALDDMGGRQPAGVPAKLEARPQAAER